jgi:dimethylaniline monooxygenase (N-oxide forming)
VDAWLPNFYNWMVDKFIVSISRKAFPNVPAEWRFSPPPSVSVTTPLVADEIYPLLADGSAEPVSAVRRITGSKHVELTDGRVLSDIDTIIYCTGYDFSVPFLRREHNPYPVIGEPADLYRNIFPLHHDIAVRHSLAFMGQVAIPLPGFVQFELVAMCISQIWLGNSLLPSFPEMQKWHRNYITWRKDLMAKQKVKSTFYVAFVPIADHLNWLDRTAGTGLFEHFGWFTRRAWEFWWRDGAFYKKCLHGLLSPAIWRLFDMGKRKPWNRAKEQVWKDNESATRQGAERRERQQRLKED